MKNERESIEHRENLENSDDDYDYATWPREPFQLVVKIVLLFPTQTKKSNSSKERKKETLHRNCYTVRGDPAVVQEETHHRNCYTVSPAKVKGRFSKLRSVELRGNVYPWIEAMGRVRVSVDRGDVNVWLEEIRLKRMVTSLVARIAALKWRIKLLATEKDRELLAVKLDNEAAWSKEGLLREQNKELATLRRERDHSDAERNRFALHHQVMFGLPFLPLFTLSA
ncbi:Uncharacterized protein Rs2_35323 [Raphanus sativus]|nr:Uncharacterized protein Rs2_35323 [Raphanus sativus]